MIPLKMKQILLKPVTLASELIFKSSVLQSSQAVHGPCCQASESLRPGSLCLTKNTKKPYVTAVALHQGSSVKSSSPGWLLPLLCLHRLQSLHSCSASMDLVHKSLCRCNIIKIKGKDRDRGPVPLNGVGCRGRNRQPSHVQKVWSHF